MSTQEKQKAPSLRQQARGKMAPDRDTNHHHTHKVRARKSRYTAAPEVYGPGGLAERLREDSEPEPIDPDLSTRCHWCGQPEPGFVDAWHHGQRVECEECGRETELKCWVRTAKLVDLVLTASGPADGSYCLGGWESGRVGLCWEPAEEGYREPVVVLWPGQSRAKVHRLDTDPHAELVGRLARFGVGVKEAGVKEVGNAEA